MKALRVKDKIWVQWRGRIYPIPAELRSSRASGPEAAADLTAPFSCKVLKVHVKAGQELKAGDPVVVVEAMKMEYSYASPRDGTVDQVLVKVGEVVSSGTHFVRWREK